MDNGEKQRYGQFIRLIKSSDTRKRKRAMRDNGFPYYQGRLGRHIQAERKELELLRKEISLENFPEASKILAYIEEIGILLYGSDYYYTLLHDGAFDFMRSILRDHITEHKGLDNLLFDGFFRKGCGEHMNSVGSDFKELSHHMDLMETFAESYNKGSQIYNSVMNPHSTEEAGNYVQKLFHLIERMRNSSKIVDKNSTLCTYHIQ